MTVAVVAFLFALVVIWLADDSDRAWKLLAIAAAIAAACTQVAGVTTRLRESLAIVAAWTEIEHAGARVRVERG